MLQRISSRAGLAFRQLQACHRVSGIVLITCDGPVQFYEFNRRAINFDHGYDNPRRTPSGMVKYLFTDDRLVDIVHFKGDMRNIFNDVRVFIILIKAHPFDAVIIVLSREISQFQMWYLDFFIKCFYHKAYPYGDISIGLPLAATGFFASSPALA